MLLIAKAFDILLRTHTCVNGFDFPLYRHNWSLDKMTTNISCKGKFWLFFSFHSLRYHPNGWTLTRKKSFVSPQRTDNKKNLTSLAY
jgi:hypothetical protein